MTGTALNLNDNFPIWYQEVSIDADDAHRSMRLAGIARLIEDADRDLIECLVRISVAIDRQEPAQPDLARVRDFFREADPTFDVANSERELQILAAATLVDLFAQSNHLGDIAALSVSTASVDGFRKLELPMDLRSLAEATLDARSVDARERPSLDDLSKSTTFKIGDGLNVESEGAAVIAVDSSHLLAMAKEVQSALRSIALKQAKTVNALAKFVEVQDEELQVLWWFIGGRSTSLDCDFGKIPAAAKPLVFGKELADETYVLPGLRTIRSLMLRAGLKENSKVLIPDAVNGADTKWLKSFIGEKICSPVTQPLHFAIERRLEVDDEKSWVDAWVTLTGIDAKQKVDSLTLAELFYREQLLRQFS